jgi:hypothetical protein
MLLFPSHKLPRWRATVRRLDAGFLPGGTGSIRLTSSEIRDGHSGTKAGSSSIYSANHTVCPKLGSSSLTQPLADLGVKVQSGSKVFDQFYNSVKNYKLPGKM